MTKRQNGEGTIHERKDRPGLWQVKAVDPTTGKRVTRTARSRAEAVRTLRTMLGRADQGAPVVDASATVRRYSEAWLDGRAGRRRAASTVREYRRRLATYVLPSIGGVRLSALTMFDVEDCLDRMAASGLSNATIRGTRNALAAMLSDAVRARHLTTNVATLARLPEPLVSLRHREVPTPDQVVALIDETKGTDLGALVSLLAGTGARIGEALAACWSDLDLDASTWRIARTVTVDSDGTAVLGRRTKTGDARTVFVPADTVAELRAQSRRVAEARLRAGEAWTDLDLVFPTSVGTVRDPHNVRHEWRGAAKAVGFPGGPHGLRHAYATEAVAALPSDTAVAKVLGHRRKATTTDLYGHLRADDSRAVGEAVVASMAAARSRRR